MECDSIATIWLIIGFIGTALFASRFLIQWIVSERAKKSIVPTAFWLFSISGGAIMLAYGIYREDPVIITGQAGGLLIYLRNLHFIVQHRKAEAEPPRTV